MAASIEVVLLTSENCFVQCMNKNVNLLLWEIDSFTVIAITITIWGNDVGTLLPDGGLVLVAT